MRSLTSLVISLLLAASPAVVKDAARSPLPDDRTAWRQIA
jgi:hypothetical protein